MGLLQTAFAVKRKNADIKGYLPKMNTHPEFGDVANVDHLWRVIQEAAKASQPNQILFVFQLQTKNDINKLLITI